MKNNKQTKSLYYKYILWYEVLLETVDEKALLLLVGRVEAVAMYDEHLEADEQVVEGVYVGHAIELLEQRVEQLQLRRQLRELEVVHAVGGDPDAAVRIGSVRVVRVRVGRLFGGRRVLLLSLLVLVLVVAVTVVAAILCVACWLDEAGHELVESEQLVVGPVRVDQILKVDLGKLDLQLRRHVRQYVLGKREPHEILLAEGAIAASACGTTATAACRTLGTQEAVLLLALVLLGPGQNELLAEQEEELLGDGVAEAQIERMPLQLELLDDHVEHHDAAGDV